MDSLVTGVISSSHLISSHLPLSYFHSCCIFLAFYFSPFHFFTFFTCCLTFSTFFTFFGPLFLHLFLHLFFAPLFCCTFVLGTFFWSTLFWSTLFWSTVCESMCNVDRTRTHAAVSAVAAAEQQPEGWRFVPDTILPGYQWALQWVGPGKDTHGALGPDQREGRGRPEHSSAQQYSAETRQTSTLFWSTLFLEHPFFLGALFGRRRRALFFFRTLFFSHSFFALLFRTLFPIFPTFSNFCTFCSFCPFRFFFFAIFPRFSTFPLFPFSHFFNFSPFFFPLFSFFPFFLFSFSLFSFVPYFFLFSYPFSPSSRFPSSLGLTLHSSRSMAIVAVTRRRK